MTDNQRDSCDPAFVCKGMACQTPLCFSYNHDEYLASGSLKAFIDQQVQGRGYGTSSEYVWELIRKDQDVQRLRTMLLEGASSAGN